MVNSMTAFSRYEVHYKWGHISWEIRSLNQRYLDIYIDLPKNLYELSMIIRSQIKSRLVRGKIECNLQLNINNDTSHEYYINKNLIFDLIFYIRWIKEQINEGEINLVDLLCYPGVLLQKHNNTHCIDDNVLTVFKKTLDQLIQNRKKEGLLLKEEIIKRLHHISKEINNIQQYIPNVIQEKRTKLLNYISESCVEINSVRLEQEILIIIQKIDISEEIDRLIIHTREMHNLLSQNEPIGRQLDFLAQELQRETNTITSKSTNTHIIHSAIALKVLVTQIREQTQNIE